MDFNEIKRKAEELYPDSIELRTAFIGGCKTMNDALLNYIQDRRKALRQSDYHPMVMNAYDGLVAKLNAIEFE